MMGITTRWPRRQRLERSKYSARRDRRKACHNSPGTHRIFIDTPPGKLAVTPNPNLVISVNCRSPLTNALTAFVASEPPILTLTPSSTLIE